jgi:hypothetical protein
MHGDFFIARTLGHNLGYYYMYIGGKKSCRDIIVKIEKSGLFVEHNIESPFDDKYDEDNFGSSLLQ